MENSLSTCGKQFLPVGHFFKVSFLRDTQHFNIFIIFQIYSILASEFCVLFTKHTMITSILFYDSEHKLVRLSSGYFSSFLSGLTNASTATLYLHCATEILSSRILKLRKQQRLPQRAQNHQDRICSVQGLVVLSHLLILPASPVSSQLMVLIFCLIDMTSLVFKLTYQQLVTEGGVVSERLMGEMWVM